MFQRDEGTPHIVKGMTEPVAFYKASRRTIFLKLVVLCVGGAATPRLAARDRPDRGPANGIVHHVADGDSLSLTLTDGRRIAVRILGIDAPELGQPFADIARQYLKNLIEGRIVNITTLKIDPFGRAVASVMHDGQDVGLTLIQAGLAWHFKRFEAEQSRTDRQAYAAAERGARQASVGLWTDRDPVPPWDYRDRQRQSGRH
jgi:endonuclease YncB( thermonuclease family)